MAIFCFVFCLLLSISFYYFVFFFMKTLFWLKKSVFPNRTNLIMPLQQSSSIQCNYLPRGQYIKRVTPRKKNAVLVTNQELKITFNSWFQTLSFKFKSQKRRKFPTTFNPSPEAAGGSRRSTAGNHWVMSPLNSHP